MRNRKLKQIILLSVTTASLLLNSVPVYASYVDQALDAIISEQPSPAPTYDDFKEAYPDLVYDPNASKTIGDSKTAEKVESRADGKSSGNSNQYAEAIKEAASNAGDKVNEVKYGSSDKAQQVQGTAEIVECLKNAGSGVEPKKLEIKAGVVADIVTSLRGFGFSDSAIIGVLFNMNAESKFNAYTMQGMGDDSMLDWIYDIDTGYLKIDDQSPNVTSDQLTSAYAARKFTTNNVKDAQTYDSGVGLCQWTATRKIKLLAIGNKFRSDYKTCVWDVSGTGTSWAIAASDLGEFYEWSQYQPTGDVGRNFAISQITIPGAALQCAFLANAVSDEHSGKEGMGDKGWFNSANDDAEQYNKYGGFADMTWDEYKGLDNPLLAAEAFAMHFERCGDKGRYDEIEKICTALAPIMDIDTSKVMQASNSYSTVEESINTVMSMATTGYITEDNLASFAQGAELNVDAKLLSGAVRYALDQSDLYSLANWERNVEYDNTDNKIITWGRRLLVAIGIIFEVWGMLIYLAYWFDRLNNFIPIDLLNILTLGKLRIADSDTEATFSLRDNSSKTNVKTVNHRAVLFIAVCALAFGTLIVTGTLFSILFSVVNFVRNLLK